MDLHYDTISETAKERNARIQAEARERNRRAIENRYGDATPEERNLATLGANTHRIGRPM